MAPLERWLHFTLYIFFTILRKKSFILHKLHWLETFKQTLNKRISLKYFLKIIQLGITFFLGQKNVPPKLLQSTLLTSQSHFQKEKRISHSLTVSSKLINKSDIWDVLRTGECILWKSLVNHWFPFLSVAHWPSTTWPHGSNFLKMWNYFKDKLRNS